MIGRTESRVLIDLRSRQLQRGAAAVEFALVVPMLILLVFGITDFGLMFNNSSVFANASRDAARAGSFEAKEQEMKDLVAEEVGYLPSVGTVTTVVTCQKANLDPCGSNYDADMEAGGTVKVKITYVHKWLTPSLIGLPNTTTITKVSQMRIE